MESVFIEHSELSNKYLDSIIAIKKIHWNYSNEEHKRWICKNIKVGDIHVLMIENQMPVAYLNLVKTEVILNGLREDFLGVGNVCSLRKGYGFGEKLMIKSQDYLVQNNLKGILFCKDALIEFYRKYHWQLISKDKVITTRLVDINIMLYNVPNEVNTVDYKERIF